mmetsp:Transcript_4865/g.9678  ORF Transcript_4865/g.9678 Transcript_4865/m.9678 type:complete len:80 (+) Transcript_4865:265-504(+)
MEFQMFYMTHFDYYQIRVSRLKAYHPFSRLVAYWNCICIIYSSLFLIIRILLITRVLIHHFNIIYLNGQKSRKSTSIAK